MFWSRLLSVLACTLCAAAVYWGSYLYFKAQELEAAAARLTLYRSTVEAELRNFSHMPFLLSQDPVVIATLNGGDRALLDRRLAKFAQSAGIDAIYLMDHDGLTISASNALAPSSFVGQNYGFRPYFQSALRGELGEFYGVGATTGEPGYFFAMPVRSPEHATTGVIAIKVDLSVLQDSWAASGERIILSNADGVVILASNPQWRYGTLRPISQNRRTEIIQARQFANEPLAPLDWSQDLKSQTATLDGERYLYLRTADLPNSWSLHFFAQDDQAAARALLTTGTLLMIAGIIFIFYQFRHVRQIGDALAQSEQQEAELRRANKRLAVEIEDRATGGKDTQKNAGRVGTRQPIGSLGATCIFGHPRAGTANRCDAQSADRGRNGQRNDRSEHQNARARGPDGGHHAAA